MRAGGDQIAVPVYAKHIREPMNAFIGGDESITSRGSDRVRKGPLMSRAKREGCRGVPMEVENINGEVRRKREGGGLVGNGG
jgi:hypothetical protein